MASVVLPESTLPQLCSAVTLGTQERQSRLHRIRLSWCVGLGFACSIASSQKPGWPGGSACRCGPSFSWAASFRAVTGDASASQVRLHLPLPVFVLSHPGRLGFLAQGDGTCLTVGGSGGTRLRRRLEDLPREKIRRKGECLSRIPALCWSSLVFRPIALEFHTPSLLFLFLLQQFKHENKVLRDSVEVNLSAF